MCEPGRMQALLFRIGPRFPDHHQTNLVPPLPAAVTIQQGAKILIMYPLTYV